MTSQVHPAISQSISERLQELISINQESHDTYQDAAESIGDVRLARQFWELSTERGAQARELQRLAAALGADATQELQPPTRHGPWRAVRGAFHQRPAILLAAAESAEEFLRNRYKSLLRQESSEPARETLERHCLAVSRAHARIRELCHASG